MSALKLSSSSTLDIYSSDTDSVLDLPLLTGISAGFPSPAMDFIDLNIDLNRHLIKHPTATFYGRVKGESMKDAWWLFVMAMVGLPLGSACCRAPSSRGGCTEFSGSGAEAIVFICRY